MASQSIYQAFEQTAEQFPKRDFLHLVQDTARRYQQPAGSISYARARREVQQLFSGYAPLQLQGGDRVALALDNRPEFFYHWLALNAQGVAVVPLNPQWRAAELEYVFEHSEAGHVICLADRIAQLESVSQSLQRPFNVHGIDGWQPGQVPAEGLPPNEIPGVQAAAPEDEAALLYTSGTTGKPKGCQLSNEYFLVSGAWYRDLGGYCELREAGDRLITPLPMYHMNAMATSTMAMLMTGGCIVPLDRFHPSSFWQSVNESEATILHYLGVMPVMLMGMERGPQERSHKLRFGFGAGLGGELHTQFEDRFGFRLIEAWAMTETGCGVAIIANREPRKVGTACFGRAGDHIDYKLVDDRGADVQPGEAGELLVRHRGANPRRGFFSGYLKNQLATDAAWQDDYFHTGDLIREDADGSMHFVDRKKNIIRRSGENISAVEVEEAILEHPQVLAVGVAPVADEIRGDEVFACVVSDVKLTDWPQLAQEIVQHCLGRLAYYKAPGYLALCAALPLTPTEKIQRMQLKALATELLAHLDCVDTRKLKKPVG
jgi:acyl-CoA synthetase (AMP-forming)/AMP-acid ligase II